MVMPVIGLQEIRDAQRAIAPFVVSTPLVRSQFLSKLCGGDVFLKLENLQVTHSFKIRGAFNRFLNLSLKEKTRGVVTASTGNHGQAVAFAAQKLNFPAVIVVPKNTPGLKIDAIKKYGAELVLFGDIYDEAEQKAKDLALKEGLVFVSPYNDESTIAGHGTIGLEIIDALPTVDAVVVPVGGGGLISGISIALKSIKPSVNVIGVQSEASPIMYESLKAGKIVDARIAESLAEGLSGGIEKGSLTFKIAQDCVDEMLLVKEETIRRAVYLLWDCEKQVVEGSGAAAIAPMLENKRVFAGKTVVSVITGGNIEAELFQSILASEHCR
jgi:threonine dehydratase